MSTKIQAGLELITAITADHLTPQELISTLHDLITKDWSLIHKIIAIAVQKKLIERGGSVYKIIPDVSGFEDITTTIRSRREDGICNLCGKQIHLCYYVDIGSRIYGPFGSTCIRKVRLME